MTLSITHQDSYSRGLLLLRTIFGWLYISIPHFFLLFFVSIWAAILQFLAWWAVLFTGKYPRSWFDFQVRTINWTYRLTASLLNLSDEYPSFGLSGTSGSVTLNIEYPEQLSRGILILRLFLSAFYVGIPHGFCLFFRMIWTMVLAFIAWWAVLFTGKYPESWHGFVTGTYRWSLRVSAYLSFLTDSYPPFHGRAE